jgi:hypothetical protein
MAGSGVEVSVADGSAGGWVAVRVAVGSAVGWDVATAVGLARLQASRKSRTKIRKSRFISIKNIPEVFPSRCSVSYTERLSPGFNKTTFVFVSFSTRSFHAPAS